MTQLAVIENKQDIIMTDIEKLITLARHYCIDNDKFWSEKYSKEASGHNNPYSDNDYNLFPRYNVLRAILQEIETLVGQNLTSFETCKQELVKIGENSHSIFTRGWRNNPIESNAMNEERKKFIEFVSSITIGSISEIEPLPYRHRLTDKEALSVRKQLLKHWNFNGDYWNPLDKKSPKETVFLMKDNLTNDDYNKIIDYLISNSNNRIYEIAEDRIDYEIEFDSLDIDLYETIITDKTFEWVIYGSHEGTITFGGIVLINFIKSLFADRQDKLNKWE